MPRNPKGLTILLGALAALGAAAIGMYLPSLLRIEAELAPGSGLAHLTLGAFLIGLGVGQLFRGAISDAYGRRWVLIGGTVLYCLASLGCITASDINELIVWRFVQALGAASGSVVARARCAIYTTWTKVRAPSRSSTWHSWSRRCWRPTLAVTC